MNLEILTPDITRKILLPFLYNQISAGFPSPALDYIEQRLDLNQYLIEHPNSTFIIRVTGCSMIDDGINDNDLLIVDKSREPVMGQIVIAEVNGQFTVKRIEKIKGKPYLVAANKKYDPIPINEETELMIWGVVTFSIHKTI